MRKFRKGQQQKNQVSFLLFLQELPCSLLFLLAMFESHANYGRCLGRPLLPLAVLP